MDSKPITLPSLCSAFPNDLPTTLYAPQQGQLHSLPPLGDLFPDFIPPRPHPIQHYFSDAHNHKRHRHPCSRPTPSAGIGSTFYDPMEVDLPQSLSPTRVKIRKNSLSPSTSPPRKRISSSPSRPPTTHVVTTLPPTHASNYPFPPHTPPTPLLPPPSPPPPPPAPPAPTGVSFDVLKPDPASASLLHVASSTTRWTAIPLLSTAAQTASSARPPQTRTPPTRTGTIPSSSSNISSTSPGAREYVFRVNIPSSSHNAIGSSAPRTTPLSLGTSTAASSSSSSAASHTAAGRPRPPAAPHDAAARAQAAFEREVEAMARPAVRRGRRARHALTTTAATAIDMVDTRSNASSPRSSSPGESPPSSPTVATSMDAESVTAAPARKRKRSDVTRPHVCPRCSKRFSRPSSLRVHGHVHTGLRPFTCPVEDCRRVFSVSSNMRRHMRTHVASGAVSAFDPSWATLSHPRATSMNAAGTELDMRYVYQEAWASPARGGYMGVIFDDDDGEDEEDASEGSYESEDD